MGSREIASREKDTGNGAGEGGWKPTACILCSVNCGIEVRLGGQDGRTIERVRGDKRHPSSQGYTCEKALRIDHYQNGRHRLTSPLRRRPDGTFEEIDWDTAVAEIAERFLRVRDTYGGESILYYGGGGQGNHLPGAYATATRRLLGNRFSSNALAQEKTGEFWVDGQLFGRSTCHTAPDMERAEVAVFLGKNPWQSHGFPRARTTLKAIANDPDRTLIVIDPRRTETAELADHHVQLRPGTDAFFLAALLAVLVQEDLVDKRFVREHTADGEPLFDVLRAIDAGEHSRRAGIDIELVRTIARRLARASSVSIYEDLGVQQAPHSTLNSWLEKLVYLLTGNFAKPGAMAIHTSIGKLFGGSESNRTTPVTGHRLVTGLVPCNVIPDEILTDHPKRFRAFLVESGNPVHSVADSQRMREALAAMELVVVIDVAMTETAKCAHYVLPAASQYEKWEATFFTMEFPENVFHLRAPILDPLPGTLPEAEIHRRLVWAMGGYTADDVAPLAEAAARGRAAFAEAFFAATAAKPELGAIGAVLLYETLGPTLPDGAAAAAVLWPLAHQAAATYPDSVRRAGIAGEGLELGENLFDALLTSRSGVVFSHDEADETWRRLQTSDGRVHLSIPELLPELAGLADEAPRTSEQYPFVLSAGERRSSTANTIMRDPGWARRGQSSGLRIHPDDAARLGVGEGSRVRIATKRGTAEAVVEITDTLQAGHVSLPNGVGLAYPGADGDHVVHGVAPNELTSTDERDWFAGTPWHKHVPARLEALVASSGVRA